MPVIRRLITEAHRRSLWQVLGIYLVGARVSYEVILLMTDGIGLPDWVPAFAFILFLVGLPVVLKDADPELQPQVQSVQRRLREITGRG